jgi:hypothetical protein
MKVYMIATIRDIQAVEESKEKGLFGIADIYDSRTIGYALSLEDAQRWVENNVCDIHEYYYKYAIIEDVAPGFYSSVDSKSIWYKWIDGKYQKIDKPAQLSQLFGFTIG